MVAGEGVMEALCCCSTRALVFVRECVAHRQTRQLVFIILAV